jgi:flagellar motor switch protein FliN/FliY
MADEKSRPPARNATPAAPASETPMPSAQDMAFELPADGGEDGSTSSAADQAAIDELLKQAQFDDPAAETGTGDSFGGLEALVAESTAPAPDTHPFDLPSFQQVMQDAQVSSIDLLRDVELSVKIELGRSRMLVEDVLKLGEGSVVELDKLAGDPVDVFVNDRLVARGEVLVLNDNFCVRVNEIVAGLKEEAV